MTESMLYPRETRTRRVQNVSGLWGFSFDAGAEGEAKGWQNGLPQAMDMPVPASFQDFFCDKQSRDYTGDMWYETTFQLPEEWRGRRVEVRFGSATHRAVVYLNGQEVARHEGGFLPFTARIDGLARFGEENRLVVKLNNELTEYTLPAGRTKTLPNGNKIAQPYFDFFNYAGLQRPVWLVATPQSAITDYTLVHSLDGDTARVDYEVTHTGEGTLRVQVLDEAGACVAEAEGKEGSIAIPGARLWRVRDAYLYTFRFTLHDAAGALLDEYAEPVGIRTVEVRGERILLNGEPVYLKGFGKHEDSDIIGRGFSLAVMKRDFELMRWIGANSVRTSHYPYSEEFYQMADREGILVIDELPAVGFMESLLNFMDASSGRPTSFFTKETTPRLLENHLAALEELVRRDKNHACVIAWSLLNEPETTDPAARPYFERLFAEAKRLDPQKRPRTFALVMNSLPGKCQCYDLCDFISLNRYYGWYMNGGSSINEAEAQFRAEMDAWQALKLERPFVFTEYGADTYAGEHKLPSVMWSEEYQREYLDMCHRVFDAYPFVQGEQVWNFADFQTGEGIMRVNGNKKGIFTRQRQPKASAFTFKQRWEGMGPDYKA